MIFTNDALNKLFVGEFYAREIMTTPKQLLWTWIDRNQHQMKVKRDQHIEITHDTFAFEVGTLVIPLSGDNKVWISDIITPSLEYKVEYYEYCVRKKQKTIQLKLSDEEIKKNQEWAIAHLNRIQTTDDYVIRTRNNVEWCALKEAFPPRYKVE